MMCPSLSLMSLSRVLAVICLSAKSEKQQDLKVLLEPMFLSGQPVDMGTTTLREHAIPQG